MEVYIVTQSNYYPETRSQDEAMWTEVVSVHSSLESAMWRLAAEQTKLETNNRRMYEEPDYRLSEDAEADTFDVIKRELMP